MRSAAIPVIFAAAAGSYFAASSAYAMKTVFTGITAPAFVFSSPFHSSSGTSPAFSMKD